MAAATSCSITCSSCKDKDKRELTELKIKFYIFLEKVISTLLKTSVDPEKVVAALPHDTTATMSDLQNKELTKLFEVGSPLYDVLKWDNTAVVARLVEVSNNNGCMAAFRDYCAEFMGYKIRRERSAVIVGDNYVGIQISAQ